MNFIMRRRKKIKNSFFELILFIISLILSFFRSIRIFLSPNTRSIKNNLFFETLDFIFKKWPKNFWKNPSFFKLFSFP